MVIEQLTAGTAILSLIILGVYAFYKVKKEKKKAVLEYWQTLEIKNRKKALENLKEE